MAREVREGQTKSGLPYLSFGEGPPLDVFPGLAMTNANPSGIQRWGEMRLRRAAQRARKGVPAARGSALRRG
jgi:hypothetical protein